MATFVLIIYLKVGYSGGWFSQEFNTKESCMAAYYQLQKQRAVDYGGCFEK